MRFLLATLIVVLTPLVALGQAKMTINKTTVNPGEPIELRYSTGGWAKQSAWIGVIPSNIPHGNESVNDQHDVDYQYIQESNGTLTFRAPIQPGSYDFRMNDGGGAEVASVT